MARAYSPITFFQRVPKPLLGRYFHQKQSVLLEVAFDELEETRKSAELIFEAFTTLPDEKQAEIEAEFQDIDSMAFQGRVKALIEEATEHPHFNAGSPRGHQPARQRPRKGHVDLSGAPGILGRGRGHFHPVCREYRRCLLEEA